MKIFILISIILVTASVGFSQKADDKSQPKYLSDSEVPRISLADAKKAFDESGAVFVDARPAVTYKEAHIKGAVNIPLGSTDNFDSLPKGKKIVVYCS